MGLRLGLVRVKVRVRVRVRVLRHFTIITQETPEMKYKEKFGGRIFGRIFEGSLVVGRWSVGGWTGGRPTTYRPLFNGAAHTHTHTHALCSLEVGEIKIFFFSVVYFASSTKILGQ